LAEPLPTAPALPEHPVPPAEPMARRRALVTLGLGLASIVATLLSITWLSRRLPREPRAKYQTLPLRRIQRRKPQVVLIGNSMVETRFDHKLLNQLTAPTRVELIALGGSESAVWYAQLKNYVVASGVPVRRVAIFFRDTEITLPALRTTGPFGSNLDRAIPKPDPVISKKIKPPSAGPIDDLRNLLKSIAPVGRLRQTMSSRSDDLIMRVSTPFAASIGLEKKKKIVNRQFRVESLRGDVDEERAPWDDSRPFPEVVEASFLPDILKLAKDHKIPLTFVRVRRRKMAAGRPDRPELVTYLREFKRYIKKRGADFLDLAGDDWETIEMYASTDHIDRRYKAKYTRLFVKHHADLFADEP